MITNTCIDCKTTSPKADTNYTLIGPKFGWRLVRRVDDQGQMLSEWRCPRCWEKYKKTTGQSTQQLRAIDAVSAVSALNAANGEEDPPSRR